MTDFAKRQVTVTLTGAQWTALLARIVRRELTPEGARVYNEACGSLQAQLLAKAQRAAKEEVWPAIGRAASTD